MSKATSPREQHVELTSSARETRDMNIPDFRHLQTIETPDKTADPTSN